MKSLTLSITHSGKRSGGRSGRFGHLVLLEIGCCFFFDGMHWTVKQNKKMSFTCMAMNNPCSIYYMCVQYSSILHSYLTRSWSLTLFLISKLLTFWPLEQTALADRHWGQTFSKLAFPSVSTLSSPASSSPTSQPGSIWETAVVMSLSTMALRTACWNGSEMSNKGYNGKSNVSIIPKM